MARLLRRWERDPDTGREEPVLPRWLERRRQRVDERKTYFRKLLEVKDRTAGALMRAGRDELEQLADRRWNAASSAT